MGTPQENVQAARHAANKFCSISIVLAVLVLTLAACGGQAPQAGGGQDGPAPDDSQASSGADDRTAKAQEEGKVVFYSSLPEEKNRILADAFTEKHGIEVEVFRAGSLKVQQKVYEELMANSLHADVFHSLYPPGFYQMKQEGHLASYTSPHHSAYPEGFIEPDHYWGTLRVVGNIIMYNTEKLGDLPAPTTWKDLLKPEYKDQLASADPTYGGTQFMQYYLWKENYGPEFISKLAEQNLQMVDSHGALAKLVVTGERPIAIEMNDYQAWSTKYIDKGPVEYVYPPENVLVVPGHIAIMKEAQHPNAARLFNDFLLSSEGQTILQQEVGAYSARKDAEPIKGRPNLSDVDQWQPDWDYLLQNESQEQQQIVDLLGGQS